MANPFTDHPSDVGEGYFEHMGQAMSFAIPMFVGACACLIHAFFPFLCLKTGSGIVTKLHSRMVTHRVKPGNETLVAPAE
jgi:hypothetical protein